MAYTTTRRGALDNEVTYEIICDHTNDLNNINSDQISFGSIAIILQGDNGLEVYMANSSKEWIRIS